MRDFIKQMFMRDTEKIENPIDDENAVRKFINVDGRVQGVGFRYFVQMTAREIGITGWVKNNTDGSVSMEIQGTTEMLDKLIEKIKIGNGVSRVEQMNIEDREIEKGANKFVITY